MRNMGNMWFLRNSTHQESDTKCQCPLPPPKKNKKIGSEIWDIGSLLKKKYVFLFIFETKEHLLTNFGEKDLVKILTKVNILNKIHIFFLPIWGPKMVTHETIKNIVFIFLGTQEPVWQKFCKKWKFWLFSWKKPHGQKYHLNFPWLQIPDPPPVFTNDFGKFCCHILQ